MVMNIDGILVICERHGHRSKFKVTKSKTDFMDLLDKNYWTIIHILVNRLRYGHQIWYGNRNW